MNLKYRAVLWDFDGVIFDSDRAVWRAVNAILAHHGLPPEPYEKFRHRANNHFDWYAERGILWSEDELRAFFYEHYDSSNCGLVTGVDKALEYIRIRQLRCGIVSAHHTDDIFAKLVSFQIVDYFAHVLGGTWYKQEALKKACHVLGVDPSETLYVGDMLSDVIDGRSVGVTTVLFAPADSPHITDADHHITHLEQLIQLLDL